MREKANSELGEKKLLKIKEEIIKTEFKIIEKISEMKNWNFQKERNQQNLDPTANQEKRGKAKSTKSDIKKEML